MTHANSSSSCAFRRRLDGGAMVAALPSRSASRGVVHVVNSECFHERVMGGTKGVEGLEEAWRGIRLPVSRRSGETLETGATYVAPVRAIGRATRCTFISKAGITSSTFKTVPYVLVLWCELYLPQGKFSALAANGNLCKSRAKLVMPTEFVAQNGTRLKQNTKIAVNGCRAHKAGASRRLEYGTTAGGRLGDDRRDRRQGCDCGRQMRGDSYGRLAACCTVRSCQRSAGEGDAVCPGRLWSKPGAYVAAGTELVLVCG